MIHFAARTGCIRSNICAAWTARCRMPTARAPAPARGTAATSRTRTARTPPRAGPIPAQRTAPRDRASSTISTAWAIKSSNWMRSSGARIDAASRPSESSAPTSTTSCWCCRPCGRCCRTRGSSPPISMPCCCIRARRPSPAIFSLHRASGCSSGPTSRGRSRRSGAAIRPHNSSRPGSRPAARALPKGTGCGSPCCSRSGPRARFNLRLRAPGLTKAKSKDLPKRTQRGIPNPKPRNATKICSAATRSIRLHRRWSRR